MIESCLFQTRQIRTRAAAKKSASLGVSTSESEFPIKSKKTKTSKAKSVELLNENSKPAPPSRSLSDFDAKRKLGSVSVFCLFEISGQGLLRFLSGGITNVVKIRN